MLSQPEPRDAPMTKSMMDLRSLVEKSGDQLAQRNGYRDGTG
ncbi:hypothetical protein D516_3334 [Rhodobacter sp. AKP1]|nr:hypothetical protein D516_3334 [Rhodobacter sp. AKP1]